MSKVTKQSHENIDASATRKNKLITKVVRHPAVLAGVLVVVAIATLVAVNAATVRKSVRFGLGGGSLTGTATSQPDGSVAFASGGGGTVASGKFYVVGKQIIDPDGNIFRPMGANVAVRQAPYLEKNFVFNYFGTANGKSEEVKAWGWNTIRVNVACNITSNPSVSETLAGLDELIKEYTAKKLVVMIDCHDGNITVKDVNYDNPSVQSAMNFFDTLAKAYKNNPYVWFNTVNEPWGSSNIPQWSDLQNKLYARIRANAPDNIFVADLSGGGNAIENLVDGNLHGTYGAGKCNLVYGWHSYGFINGFADDAKLKHLYNNADMFVFPTLFEGMPTVVLEAMSYCLPVIVTDTGATAELVDNTNGYLIDKQSPIALKNAVKTFFALPERDKQKMADCSYNKVMERFTWPQVAKRHYELFQQFWNKK